MHIAHAARYTKIWTEIFVFSHICTIYIHTGKIWFYQKYVLHWNFLLGKLICEFFTHFTHEKQDRKLIFIVKISENNLSHEQMHIKISLYFFREVQWAMLQHHFVAVGAFYVKLQLKSRNVVIINDASNSKWSLNKHCKKMLFHEISFDYCHFCKKKC